MPGKVCRHSADAAPAGRGAGAGRTHSSGPGTCGVAFALRGEIEGWRAAQNLALRARKETGRGGGGFCPPRNEPRYTKFLLEQKSKLSLKLEA